MTTPQDIIRAWCASCGMAEPSNGDVAALLSLLFPDVPSAQWHAAPGVGVGDCDSCQGTGSGGMGLGCTDCLGTGVDPAWRPAPAAAIDASSLTDVQIADISTNHVSTYKRDGHTFHDFNALPFARAVIKAALASRPEAPAAQDAELLVSAYRLAVSLTGDQSLLVMELANRFARLSGKSAGDAQ